MNSLRDFPYTDEQLGAAGLLDEDTSRFVQQAIETMRAHPGLLMQERYLSCIPRPPTLSDVSYPSVLSLASQDSDATVNSPYAVSEYEKTAYYNGITDDGDHPDLLYRSDFSTNPFPRPRGRYGHLPSKSVQGVYNTSLNKVWSTVGPQIRDLVKVREIRYSSIDPARFITYGEDDEETLGPVVIWVGIYPGSDSPDTAHEVSQDILALLVKDGVEGAVVQWRVAVPSKLAGPALMRVVGSNNHTAHVRRIFTAALNIPLATKERESEDAQGSLTLYFHEGRDEHGNVSDKVLGISNCHVLRKNNNVDYEFKGAGVPKQHVRVNGLRRFQQGLDETRVLIGDHAMLAGLYAREIIKLEGKDLNRDDEGDSREINENLLKQKKAIADLEAFYDEIKEKWSDIGLRNIGHDRYAKAISVDVEGKTRYTEDWGAFEVDEAKVKPEFGGTFVDLGTAITPWEVKAMFYPQSSGRTSFKYPEGRRHTIKGVVTPELLASPDLCDSENQPCIIVGKDESFLCNELGVESIELGIYSWGKNTGAFSDKGDSGALVWDGLGRVFGQLHSGQSKGGWTSSHVSYATPGWFLLQRIKAKFPHAVFFRDTWSE